MNPSNPMPRSLLALAAISLAPAAMAAVVFSETNLATGVGSTGLEILNSGTVVRAYHFGGTSITDITVNGVLFEDGGQPGAFNDTAMTGTWDGGWGPDWDGDWNLSAIADPDYRQLVSSMGAFQHPTGDPAISPSTITISGLSIGQEYRLQLISNNPRDGMFDVEGSTHTLSGGDNGQPVVLAATWTATDDTLNVALVGTSHGDGPHFNGYVLQTIPEPAATLLGGLGLLTLMRRRR